jgi:hypothetical protein
MPGEVRRILYKYFEDNPVDKKTYDWFLESKGLDKLDSEKIEKEKMEKEIEDVF